MVRFLPRGPRVVSGVGLRSRDFTLIGSSSPFRVREGGCPPVSHACGRPGHPWIRLVAEGDSWGFKVTNYYFTNTFMWVDYWEFYSQFFLTSFVHSRFVSFWQPFQYRGRRCLVLPSGVGKRWNGALLWGHDDDGGGGFWEEKRRRSRDDQWGEKGYDGGSIRSPRSRPGRPLIEVNQGMTSIVL